MSAMRIDDFALERFFARYEFSARHLLCASDVQGWAMRDLLALADAETSALWESLTLGYTEAPGHPLLRAEIASLYESIQADEVLVFSGAEEGIFVLANVLLGPGDHAIVVWPAYQSLHEVARAVGADVTLHELREDEGWAIDLDRLRREITPRTRLIVANAPHNPTGALPDAATYRAIVDLAAEAGATLLSDEVYRYLELDPADRLPAGADAAPHAVSLGVMSKSFALAGLRIGWLATHDTALLDRAARFKDYTTICNAAPSELLALIALRARGEVLGRSRGIVESNLALLDQFFARQAGRFAWVRPRGGSIGFPRLLADVSIDRFADELIETEGVLLAPGSVFGHPGNHFRLGFGRTDLPAALERLEAFAERTLA
ncbi:MAG TPA: aminotransferase class I/II-fold pyridoxal phosphate-dependent enzyme [Candidatus Limnocylindrales bacterium]|nr:aminotransferase class I/II-fold pyridoxal phosphate-dependent enzyme [Candidatus Limnocylindrales bacterium]